MAVTIKDVAKAAGVAHSTVSRALSGNKRISPATAKRVREAADRLGYVPNRAAQGLKTAKSNAIGVIIRRFSDPFNAAVLDGIEDCLQANGYSLFLAASGHDIKKDNEIIASMAERRIEGLILCSKRIDESQRARLRKFDIPMVHLNEQGQHEALNVIVHDDAFGAEALTKHLIDLGHRRIGYVANTNAGMTNSQRLIGYHAALGNASLSAGPEWMVEVDNGQAHGGAEAVAKLLALPQMPTAIVCFNDMVAVGAMRALSEAGLSVPKDVSVTGFDGVELAAYMTPPLTTFSQPRYVMGRTSAEMLLRLINGEQTAPCNSMTVHGELQIRASTAAPSRN